MDGRVQTPPPPQAAPETGRNWLELLATIIAFLATLALILLGPFGQ